MSLKNGPFSLFLKAYIIIILRFLITNSHTVARTLINHPPIPDINAWITNNSTFIVKRDDHIVKWTDFIEKVSILKKLISGIGNDVLFFVLQLKQIAEEHNGCYQYIIRLNLDGR